MGTVNTMWLCKNSLKHLGAWLVGLAIFSAHAHRAIWMWEADSYAMLEHAALAQNDIAFLQSKGIGTLYLYADAYQGRNLLVEQPQTYAALIERLHKAGFEVHALLGSWYLHTERYVLPEQQRKAHQMLQRVIRYNAQVKTIQQFDGVSLDIEPHLLDAWDTQKTYLLEQFVQLSQALMQIKVQAHASFKLGAAIPFWFDAIAIESRGTTQMLNQHLQDIYDYVVLMDYRDHAQGADGILSHAQDELAYAQRIGKSVWIGVETGANEIEKVSFHHLREADMERELDLVNAALASHAEFGGVVIHHFSTYRQWVQRLNPSSLKQDSNSNAP